ncbi:MAG: hypothetical protein O2913_11290 [Chloroflexi bacterium]|nr:hypothetical protein [Chloroflexota bacterium]
MFWVLPLIGCAVLLTACQQEDAASTPITLSATNTAVPSATPVDNLARTKGDSPTEESTPADAPASLPSVQADRTQISLPTPTSKLAPTPTAAPTIRTEDCRVSYPTAIVSGPSVPNRPHDGDRVFHSLTVHPLDPDIVLLGTERNGFMSTQDGGVTWSRYRAGLRSGGQGYSEVWDIDFSASNPDIIMAATLDSPGPPTGEDIGGGIYRSIDGGQTWTQLNFGFDTSRAVSIRIDPSNPEIAVAGMEGGWPSFTGLGADQYYPGGVYRTEDGGQNWSRVTVDPNDGRNGYVYMRVTRGNSPQIVTFGKNRDDPSENVGFMRSNDLGRTWELFAPEFRTKSIGDFDLSADGQSIYVNEGDTYFGWISKDAGATWSQGPILQVNGPIAVSPVDPDLVIFASSGDIRRSTDGLASFASMSIVLSGIETVREVVFSPSHPNIVYAETDGYFLYRSDDAGLTWKFLVNGRKDVLNAQP